MSYAEVNGIDLYYEIHGTGEPVILLHGGLGSGEMFTPMLSDFTARHQVILVDLQGHGRTADIDRPIDLQDMARDVAALIDHLGLVKPDVVGFSLGGGVGLRLAILAPEKIGRLVSAAAGIRRSAGFPDILEQQKQVNAASAEFMKDTPMYELYQRVAPRPGDFPRLLDKIGESMQRDYDLTEEVRGLQVPTLIVGADADMVPTSHFVEIFNLLDGGLRDGGWDRGGRPKGGHALAIIPGTTHYDLLDSPLFAPVALSFLDQAD
ncbi:alpha/beta fold hydrolase [Actinoplanes derwentensis]|uniref:Pimeloyl-ACP methyl ester carboxylesterase n=1 Tax=Actinoplanes derwentensis TaxID=113562 RepID=A0A1H1QQI9_9ACTN|nr:alpha/beta hydrolase [Actinoplanes derwentensis]GID89359.1 alpha/beta hydrolase [Actinoplanes derwentensis]SDS25617.1 Pimeloyl-ACP methyl ester carboxylesterase [Actinoplanes derwentensis]